MFPSLRSRGDARCLSRRERLEVALLSGWFFAITMTLWLLKPIRTAALLTHLGSADLPYLRLASVLVVGLVVFGYVRIVNRLSRLRVTLGASAAFGLLILAVWASMWMFGEGLGRQRWFVWGVYCLVDAYATVMVTVFWTYTNDVVSRTQADRLYPLIGMGGILGGIAGGVAIDGLVHWLGPLHLLLLGAACVAISAGLAWASEALLAPAPRRLPRAEQRAEGPTLEGALGLLRSNYLLWMAGIVVAYESAAALTDFVVNIIFERSFSSELELTQMYGRLGWIVSATALASQLLIVPVILPAKRVALMVPPLVMAVATLSLAILPIASLAIVMAASDRGLNYSLQQVTRETLYVPLSDAERYKAKAIIDIFVDRAAKAFASLALVVVMLISGTSLSTLLVLALAALLFWMRCAHALGRCHAQVVRQKEAGDAAAPPPPPQLELSRGAPGSG